MSAATHPALSLVPDDLVPDETPVPVDQVVEAHPVQRRRELPRRPVLPAILTDKPTATAAASWAVRYSAHTSAFHTVRLPVYSARLAARSPVGAWRISRDTFRWVIDAESRPVLAALGSLHHIGSSEAAAFLKLTQERRRTTRVRALVVALALVAALWVAISVSGAALAGWQLGGLAAALVAALGWAGRSADKPITSRSVSGSTAPRMTSDLILTALGSLGIGELNKGIRLDESNAVRFVAPVCRDGAGWRADLDLPAGVTAGDIMERRDRLASGLRRPEGCVWPEADESAHAGRLVLWVGDRPLSAAKPVTWPLVKAGRVNLFEPIPFGVDQRGGPITVTLMFASMVVGAVPRMGKTAALRLILLAAALDPRAEIHAHNLKGGPDLAALEAVAHYYRSGDDPEDIGALMVDLRAVKEDMRRRYKTMRDLPRDLAPDAKVTDDLASKRSLRLHPVVVALDECQILFENSDFGKEGEALVLDLVKRGPAVGISCIVATQRPDAKSLPTGISANAVLRLCLKVQGQVENDMVLGTSSYKAGIRATMFSRKDLGVAYLAGEGADPVIVRAAYVDTQDAATVTARARAARAAAGLLSGMAAGEIAPDLDTASVLDHLAAVWPIGEPRVWCETLAERLAVAYPGAYTGWTGEQVTASVKPHGLRTSQVKRGAHNRRGLTFLELSNTLARRDSDPLPEVAGSSEGSNPATEPATHAGLRGSTVAAIELETFSTLDPKEIA